MVCTSVLPIVVLLSFIEFSSQSHVNNHSGRNSGPSSSSAANLHLLAECISHMEENPDCERNPFPSSPSARKRNLSDRTLRGKAPLRARSRSPASIPPSTSILGYSLEELGYIRLIPRTNEHVQFEFRRYVFLDGERIRLREKKYSYSPVPTKEHIVLSTANGDILAILMEIGLLRGLYKRDHSRIKIDMKSGVVHNLTPDEVRDCPVGKNHPIFPSSFIKAFGDFNSLQPGENPDDKRSSGSSSASARQHSPNCIAPQENPLHMRSVSPPGRPPSEEIFGYAMKQLGYIRLIPLANPSQRFELRRYVIPSHKSIRLLIGIVYVPVPNREHMVLSTSHGDVYGILEYTGLLRGLYTTNSSKARVKINMLSGAVEKMTATELKECHVGNKFPVFPRWFTADVSDEDSLHHVYR